MGALPAAGSRRPEAAADRRPQAVSGIAAAVAAAGVIALAYVDRAPVLTLGALTLALWAGLFHAWALRWRVQAIALVVIVMFIPIGRYALPGDLPFQLEPYRVMVVFVAVIYVASLLVQPHTRYKPIGFAGPFWALFAVMLASIGMNADRVHSLGLQTQVVKGLSYFASFLVVALIVNNMIGTRRDLDVVLKTIVGCGAVLGLLTILESRTGITPFDSLGRVFPILQFQGAITTLEARGGDFRALGSAQHPIALGALLALLLPVAIYVARRYGSRRWWLAAALLAIGVLTTVARTATLMLIVEVLVLLALKPRVMIRLWPWALPFLVVVHFVAPGTLGTLKTSFFPKGGLVAEQKTGAGTYGSNRLADLGPALEEWRHHQYFGQGYGTRISDRTDPKVNSPILDNQWLGWLLETGVVGVAALLWLVLRATYRFGRAGRRDPTDHGWLLASLAASVLAFAIGMLTYDAFAFTQTVIMLFILLGIGSAALRLQNEPDPRLRL
jgi:O-antigen ligase